MTPSHFLKLLLIGLSLLTPWAMADSTQIVQIGYAGPLSGSATQIGQSQMHAAELALKEANARGLHVDGKLIVFKLLAQDDRSDPNTAALVANYLVKAGVVAVIGHWNTGASMSAAGIYSAGGIPQIAAGSSARQYTKNGYATSFRIIGHDDEGGHYAAIYAVQTLKARRIAVIHDETSFGTGLANQFINSVVGKNVTIVTRQLISSKTSDFNSALNESKKVEADLIFFGGLGPQAAALKLSMKRMAVNARLLAADGIVSPLFPKLTGADGNGTLGLAPWQELEKMNGWKKFKEAFNADYGSNIEPFAPFAYDAAQVIVAAIKQANSLAPVRIATTLHSIRYPGLTGMISFDAEGNLSNPVYTIFEVQDGKWVPVQKSTSR